MIIEASKFDMTSSRKSSSSLKVNSMLTTWGNSSMRSGLSWGSAVSLARNTVGKDPNGQKKQNSYGSDDLLARFTQTRSIRANTLESNRNIRALQRIRRQSINYLMRQLFWRDNRMSMMGEYQSPVLMLNQQTQEFGGQLTSLFSYNEMEDTSFATKGTVVTASGQELEFNLELNMSRSFYESTTQLTSFGAEKLLDPLVINLDTDVASVSDQTFYFDLDADGHEELVSQLSSGSGYLALDKNGDGMINNGSELFGATTGNGFSELAQYDSDGNGWIDEADEIFNQLLIWRKDENGQDVLCGLGAAGIGAICLESAGTQFSLNDAADNHTNAVIRRTGIFLYENGTAGSVQQMDLALQDKA